MTIYTSPNHDVIIRAEGGARVLSALGFKTEFQIESERRAAEKKAKASAFFAEFKEKGIIGYRASRPIKQENAVEQGE